MTVGEIKDVLGEAHAQAAAVAQRHDDGDLRILAIAIGETARASLELVKKLEQ